VSVGAGDRPRERQHGERQRGARPAQRHSPPRDVQPAVREIGER